MSQAENDPKPVKYRVRYFDAEKSRRGKGGVWSRMFDNREEAEKFAAANKLYAKPCIVEVVS